MICGLSGETPRTRIQSSLRKGGLGFPDGPVRCVTAAGLAPEPRKAFPAEIREQGLVPFGIGQHIPLGVGAGRQRLGVEIAADDAGLSRREGVEPAEQGPNLKLAILRSGFAFQMHRHDPERDRRIHETCRQSHPAPDPPLRPVLAGKPEAALLQWDQDAAVRAEGWTR